MASKITYTCDQCDKPIPDLYGPLLVSVTSFTEPQCNENIHVCDFACLARWASNEKRGA